MDEMNVKAVETEKTHENMTPRPKIIAVDFDGCLAVNKWPEIGAPIESTIQKLKSEQANGAKVILWTNRVGEPLEKAVQFCKEQGIHLDEVNKTCRRLSRPLAATVERSLPMSIGTIVQSTWLRKTPGRLGRSHWLVKANEPLRRVRTIGIME